MTRLSIGLVSRRVEALAQVDGWGAGAVAVAVVRGGDVIAERGPRDREFRWASITKPAVALATLVAAEEGVVDLDEPAGPEGSTVRHLLAHASGLPFHGDKPIATPGHEAHLLQHRLRATRCACRARRRDAVPGYLRQAVFAPLGMGAELRGSAGADVYGTLDDLVALARELQSPTLVAPETLAEMTSVQFAGLNGVLPDVGRFDPNDWGLGVELRDAKAAALDRHAQLGADVRPLRRQRHVPLDRSGGRPRARVPDGPRVRQLGARGVAQAVGRGAGGSVKVSVVGAGVMGLATARVLAQRGHDVTVYEQFELKHKRGSSHGTSRIFRLSYDEEHWIRLAQRAYELWRELEQESGRTLLELDGLWTCSESRSAGSRR